MSTINAALPQRQDWHPADVIAALHKRNLSLRGLAAAHGYSHIQRVLTGPWLAAEHIVAKALEVQPQEIWPSRYAIPNGRARAAALTRKYKLRQPGRGKPRAAARGATA